MILSPAKIGRRLRRAGVAVACSFAPALLAPAPTVAQTAEEPVLESLTRALSHEGMRFGILLQVVVDPSLDRDDTDAASVQVAAMRFRLTGQLDEGFEYLVQTNFAGSPSILDARVGWWATSSFGVQAGRFKTPFSRELLTYAGAIDFVNRARVVEQLSPGRQSGVQLIARPNERVSITAGAFTGAGSSPDHESLAGVGRLEVSSSRGSGTRVAAAAHAAVGRDGAIGGSEEGRGFEGDGVLLGGDLRVESGRLLLAAEVISADWDPVGAGDHDAAGLYVTAGWKTNAKTQLLARWDRYRAPRAHADDAVVIGFNLWPTGASEVQVNWLVPVNGSETPHKLLVNFQIGF